MDVELTNLTTEHLAARAIIKLAKKVGRLVGLPKAALISVVFIDKVKMRELNFKYRGKDEPTDVLSFLFMNEAKPRRTLQSPTSIGDERRRFSLEKVGFVTPKFVRLVFGEIFLCPEMIRTRAAEREMSEEEYQKLLIVHAMLHLKGLEHGDNKEAEEMEHKEIEILNKIKNF